MKKDSSKPAVKLTREQWLRRALEVIAAEGRGQLSIDELATGMGVTKGSFYWHFENREEFVESLLEFWIDEFIAGIVKEIEALTGSAKDRLLAVAEAVTKDELARYDLAMRAWAMRDEAVAQAVVAAEAIRFGVVRNLFREIGFKGDELDMRSRTFVAFYSFDLGLRTPVTRAERLRQVRLRHEMLVRR